MKLAAVAKGAMSLLVRRHTGSFGARRRWLNKTQWLREPELKEIQLRLLKRLVRHCYNHVPYYHDVMSKRGLLPDHIESLEDLDSLPILTKEDVLGAGRLLWSRGFRRWLSRTAYTGGTTGTPLQLRRDLFAIGNEHAFVRRQWDWAGVGMRDRCAYLTGRLIVPPNRTEGPLYVYDPVMKELILSTYHLTVETAKSYAQTIQNYKVKAIVGYPSAVCLLAKACLASRIGLRVQSVLTSSETLTQSMRETITDAFGCKVFDFYGSAERVCYIHTCEHGTYHIVPEYGLVTLVPVESDGEATCRVVSTGFWNYAMPLIRYELPDLVVPSSATCACGRAFPVIREILGREADVVKTPSGREFGAAILTHLLYGTANIVESQIIQDGLDHITIAYVPSRRFSHKDMQAFETLLKKHLPAELRVAFKQVDRVERTKSGKIRPVVSKV